MIKMNFDIATPNEFYFIPRYLQFKHLKIINIIEMKNTTENVVFRHWNGAFTK